MSFMLKSILTSKAELDVSSRAPGHDVCWLSVFLKWLYSLNTFLIVPCGYITAYLIFRTEMNYMMLLIQNDVCFKSLLTKEWLMSSFCDLYFDCIELDARVSLQHTHWMKLM